jgi:hypothetical protein
LIQSRKTLGGDFSLFFTKTSRGAAANAVDSRVDSNKLTHCIAQQSSIRMIPGNPA